MLISDPSNPHRHVDRWVGHQGQDWGHGGGTARCRERLLSRRPRSLSELPPGHGLGPETRAFHDRRGCYRLRWGPRGRRRREFRPEVGQLHPQRLERRAFLARPLVQRGAQRLAIVGQQDRVVARARQFDVRGLQVDQRAVVRAEDRDHGVRSQALGSVHR